MTLEPIKEEVTEATHAAVATKPLPQALPTKKHSVLHEIFGSPRAEEDEEETGRVSVPLASQTRLPCFGVPHCPHDDTNVPVCKDSEEPQKRDFDAELRAWARSKDVDAPQPKKVDKVEEPHSPRIPAHHTRSHCGSLRKATGLKNAVHPSVDLLQFVPASVEHASRRKAVPMRMQE